MARAVRFRRESQSQFSKLFTDLCQRKSSWEVWADFIAMAAITISNGFDREGKTHDDREKQYMRTIKGYNQESNRFSRNCLPYWWRPWRMNPTRISSAKCLWP